MEENKMDMEKNLKKGTIITNEEAALFGTLNIIWRETRNKGSFCPEDGCHETKDFKAIVGEDGKRYLKNKEYNVDFYIPNFERITGYRIV